jgi:integrase
MWIDPRRAETSTADVAQEWLTSNAAKRGGSLARDRSILQHHVIPVIGKKPIDTVTKADIQNKLVNQWTEKYAPSSVGRMYSCLRAVLTYAVDAEYIGRSPCRGIRLPEAPPRRAQVLNRDQLSRLADALGPDAPMLYLAALGPRWGEIAGLRVGRIDFLRQTITIDAQRTRGDRGQMVEHGPKTTRTVRTFKVDDWMIEMLSAHLARRGLTASDPDALVFVSKEGAPLHYSNWRRNVWIPATKAVGLPELHFHDVRKTAVSLLLSERVDIRTAQARLGLSEQVMLRIYAQPVEEADTEAAEKIGTRIRPQIG